MEVIESKVSRKNPTSITIFTYMTRIKYVLTLIRITKYFRPQISLLSHYLPNRCSSLFRFWAGTVIRH